jgi:hypothetical protein
LNNFDNSLIGWWRGEGDALDASGNGNDGTLIGGATYATGKFGQAFSLDGEDDYIDMESSSSLNLQHSFTMSAWVKTDTIFIGTQRILGRVGAPIGEDLGGDGYGWGIVGNQLRFTTFNKQDYDSTLADINPDTWYHLAIVFDSNNAVSFYVDGEYLETIAGYESGDDVSEANFTIGNTTYFQEPWSGSIDDVAIFDRVLSEGEISSLYNAFATQYDNTFTGLARGEHTTQAHAVDLDGNKASTEERTFTVGEESEAVEEEAQKAHIDSWEYSLFTDQSSCPEKLKLEIKGKHFKANAKVKIGNKKAAVVDKKSSKKLVASFCIDKLLDNKPGTKRTVSVKNPDTDTEKADKKIDLSVLTGFSNNNIPQGNSEWVKNIQSALVKLGYLDSQYVTGVYGPITTKAVKKFQADNGIEQTGTVGPITKAKLVEKVK